MGLNDVVANSGLSIFAQIALVVFFIFFVGVVAYVLLRRGSAWEHARQLPLEDDGAPESAEETQR